MSTSPPDIVVFISDQHTARLMGCAGDTVVETPNLDALARAGMRFSAAQAACPLCVPSRCSFMTGRLPTANGVLTNGNIMPSEVATFAHQCGAAGYETVLCGRMHFTGQDQRHGFARRIMGDFTPCIAGRSGALRSDLGPYVGTPASDWQKLVGGGDSPVLAYDRAVIAAALNEIRRERTRPLLLVIGTYGPHHTFVAPEDLYAKYHARVPEPLPKEAGDWIAFDHLGADRRKLSVEEQRDIRAAYYGMIEQTDRHVGTVATAWNAALRQTGRPGVFVYTSDHGEQAGNRGLWGKMSFFPDSIGVPLIVAGAGAVAGAVCATPVSLMDLGVTIGELSSGPSLPQVDGRSLVPALRGELLPTRPVISEVFRGGNLARMVTTEAWSYWRAEGFPGAMLVDRQADPFYLRNVADEHPATCAELDDIVRNDWNPSAILADQRRRREAESVFSQWGAHPWVPEPDRWVVPQSSWVLPRRHLVT